MSLFLRLNRNKSALIKGLLLIVVVVAFGSIALYSYDGTLPFQKGGSTLDREKRNMFYRPPCYNDSSTYYCRPTIYLIGFQYGGQNLLREALNLHPDIDCYTTGYFSSFSNLSAGIDPFNLQDYHILFQNSTDKIRNGSNTIICDSGPDLARTYDLDPISFLPEFKTMQVLDILYGLELGLFVIFNRPTARFINEYCTRDDIPDDFDDYVDQSIADYLACENNDSRSTLNCLYDASLSGVLQAGLYTQYYFEEIVPVIQFGDSTLVGFDLNDFSNSTGRYNIMSETFGVIGIGVPPPGDPYWTQLDNLFDFTPGECNGRNISDEARAKLTDFYDERSSI